MYQDDKKSVGGVIKQILTAFARAMVKTLSVIPRPFKFPSAAPRENRTLQGSVRYCVKNSPTHYTVNSPTV